MRRIGWLVVPLLVLLLAPSPATAGQKRRGQNFGTHLTGAEEVPPVTTQGQGQVKFHLSRDKETMGWKLNVSNISNVVAAHIHCGAVGVNGPIMVTLYTAAPGGGPANGRLASGSFDPTGDPTIPLCNNVPLIQAMKSGNTYVNVHTDNGVAPPNTGAGDMATGEIRGQVEAKGPKQF